MHTQERRSTNRLPSTAKGYVILNGVDLDLRAHDISSAGVLVEFSSSCSIREGVKLRVHLDIGYVGTAIVCRTIISDERILCALQFEEQLPATIIIH